MAFGPKPRSYAQRTPKKMVRLALRSALSDRASEGRVALVDTWDFEVPSTKAALASLEALELSGRVLVVLGEGDGIADRSFGNLPEVQSVLSGELNAYDVLVNDWVVFTDETLPAGTAGEAVTAATDADGATDEDGGAEADPAEPEAHADAPASEGSGS